MICMLMCLFLIAGCQHGLLSSRPPTTGDNAIQSEQTATPGKQTRTLAEHIKINNHYSFRTYKADYCVSYEILHDGKVAYASSDCEGIQCSLSDEEMEGSTIFPPAGKNITGDGIPNLIVGCISGGSHCCSRITIFSLGDSAKVLKEFDCPYCTFELTDLDGDGIYEIIMSDSTFQTWASRHGADEGYTNQNVILRYKNRDYRIAPDLMKKFPNKIDSPSQGKIVRQFDDADAVDPSNPERGLLELSRYMTALIYVGRGGEAFDFCHRVWPKNREGKKEFIASFKTNLAKSPYWQEIKALNGW